MDLVPRAHPRSHRAQGHLGRRPDASARRHGNTPDPETATSRGPAGAMSSAPACTAPSATAASAGTAPPARPTPTTSAPTTPASAATPPPTPITASSSSAKNRPRRHHPLLRRAGVRPRPGRPADRHHPGHRRRPGTAPGHRQRKGPPQETRQNRRRRNRAHHRTGNPRRPRRPRRPGPAQPHPRPVHRALRPTHQHQHRPRHPGSNRGRTGADDPTLLDELPHPRATSSPTPPPP